MYLLSDTVVCALSVAAFGEISPSIRRPKTPPPPRPKFAIHRSGPKIRPLFALVQNAECDNFSRDYALPFGKA